MGNWGGGEGDNYNLTHERDDHDDLRSYHENDHYMIMIRPAIYLYIMGWSHDEIYVYIMCWSHNKTFIFT